MKKTTTTLAACAAALCMLACTGDTGAKTATADTAVANTATDSTQGTTQPASSVSSATPAAGATDLPPNELGRIPVLEYHLIGPKPGMWTRTPADLKQDLQTLYDRGYRPVNMVDVLDRKLDLPRGISPVVFVFDDASPSQFRYIERNGTLEIDPTSAVGIWKEFQKTHSDWPSRGVFCVLSGAEAGRSFFGDKGIEGQKSEWRFKKLQYLKEEGFEICNHTLWHMTMSKYGSAQVQEQIARLALAVDSALPGYKIRTLALPLGEWPKDKTLAHKGSWTDPKSGKNIAYDYDAVLLVAGGPARSPHDPQYDPLRYTREIITGTALTRMLDRLDKDGTRYISDGDAQVVAKPAPATKPAPPASNATQ